MTGPLSSITGLLKHPLTDIGIAQFIADYEKGNKQFTKIRYNKKRPEINWDAFYFKKVIT